MQLVSAVFGLLLAGNAVIVAAAPQNLIHQSSVALGSSWWDALTGLKGYIPSAHNHEEHRVEKIRYDDHIVIRFNVASPVERTAVEQAAEAMVLDIWSSSAKHVDVHLPQSRSSYFLKSLPRALRESYDLMIPNVQQAIDATTPSPLPASAFQVSGKGSVASLPGLPDAFFQDYQPLSTIDAWLHLLTALYPDRASILNIGTTPEGRSILGLKVKSPVQSPQKRKGIFIQGAQHAREWVSVSTVCYALHQMVSGYDVDPEVRALVEGFEWTFVPTVNPDGYAYSWEEDRLWRKNRQNTSLPYCKGLDLDRTWGYKWGAGAKTNIATTNPCSENYRGEEPFAATEPRLISDFIQNRTSSGEDDILAFLDLHSYSQTIQYPWAYDCSALPPDAEDLDELGIGIAHAIRRIHYENYDVESVCGNPDPTEAGGMPGAAIDWAYGEQKIRWSYSIKLRDTGSYGFLLPKEEIVPTGEEVFSGIKYLAKFIADKA
ncbi:Putative metallocarboxypeptidase ecm14 [Saitoella coloradoensis]